MGLFNKANNFLANEDEVLLVGEQNDQKNEKTPYYETKVFHQNKLFAFSDFITKYKIHIFAIFELESCTKYNVLKTKSISSPDDL